MNVIDAVNIIDKVRQDREDLARVLKKHMGIRRIVEDLYPDSAHFIYELLQNAEDTGATEANFTLSKASLIFEHNGRPFERRDIEAITDIGEGTKVDDSDKIGRFGVGFKAVFAYSETPHIWSSTFSFKITDLVLPSRIDPKPDLGNRTCFEFPFNNPKKTTDMAYAEVMAGLRELSETTLLFLSNLRSIRWHSDQTELCVVRRVYHSEHHVEVLSEVLATISGWQRTGSFHFLKFDQPVEGLERQRVAVAFALDFLPGVQEFDSGKPLAHQMKIVPAEPGRVAVFFPAEKETSGLRFHLHAPFVPELSRASIKDTSANQPLFQQLATLAAASLHQIHDLGLLTAEFLAVLPNRQDILPERYQNIHKFIVDEMNNQPLTPTHARSHAPATRLLQAKASLKDLLSRKDIKFLLNEEKQWAINALRGSDADRFLSDLAITEWDTDQFVEWLSEKASDKTIYDREQSRYVTIRAQDFMADFMAWISRKSVNWHQEFYALLFDFLQKFRWQKNQLAEKLKSLPVVRLSDGHYSVGGECFFPSDGVEQDEVLSRVDAGIYTSGKSKSEQENAKNFLKAIGVRDVGEAEQVEAILKQRYVAGANFKFNKRDIERFIALVEKEPSKAKLFAEYLIFKRKDRTWGKPSQVFLDQPFMDTNLSAYYDALGMNATRAALAESYQDCGITIDRLTEFAKAVGVQTRLEISEVSCYKNKDWEKLRSVGGNKTVNSIDRDYRVERLEEILNRPSLAISKLIWKTMSSLPPHPNYLKAEFQNNRTTGSHRADSQLVHQLRDANWIPRGNGSFVRPAEASRDLLPDGFPYDPGWLWLEAIKFGQEAIKKSDEQRKEEDIAKGLGFVNTECLERAKLFVALPLDEQKRFLDAWAQKQDPDLPKRESIDPERRANLVTTGVPNAPVPYVEDRIRSVSVGREGVKQEAAQYLQQYTNSDQEMICQVCKAPLPFKLDNGSSYFEMIEFLKLKRCHYQNYLALCPNHAAMFMYANGSANEMQEMFVNLTGSELAIELAREKHTIYFTKTHILDLKTIIETEQAEPDSVDNAVGKEVIHENRLSQAA